MHQHRFGARAGALVPAAQAVAGEIDEPIACGRVDRSEIIVTGSRIAAARTRGHRTGRRCPCAAARRLRLFAFRRRTRRLSRLSGFGDSSRTAGPVRPGGELRQRVRARFEPHAGAGGWPAIRVFEWPDHIFGRDTRAQVDLNAIPSILVDRVERLAIGGAPAYGSDAIAATVNVRLRRRVTGLELRGLSGRRRCKATISAGAWTRRAVASSAAGAAMSPLQRVTTRVGGVACRRARRLSCQCRQRSQSVHHGASRPLLGGRHAGVCSVRRGAAPRATDASIQLSVSTTPTTTAIPPRC